MRLIHYYSSMNCFGDKDPGQFGSLQGTKTLNTSIREQAKGDEKIISIVLWMRMGGGVHLNLTLLWWPNPISKIYSQRHTQHR